MRIIGRCCGMRSIFKAQQEVNGARTHTHRHGSDAPRNGNNDNPLQPTCSMRFIRTSNGVEGSGGIVRWRWRRPWSFTSYRGTDWTDGLSTITGQAMHSRSSSGACLSRHLSLLALSPSEAKALRTAQISIWNRDWAGHRLLRRDEPLQTDIFQY